MLLLSVEEMKEWEKQADEGGYTFTDMMKTAGRHLADYINKRWQHVEKKVITGLVGGGKNGADTMIALTGLQNSGWQTKAILLDRTGHLEWVMKNAVDAGCEVVFFDQQEKQASQAIKDSYLILDGVIGTGFKPPMRTDLSEKMKSISSHCSEKTIIAVDCPSGVDCSTGLADPVTLGASITVCMEAVKVGLVKMPAFAYCGEIVCLDIGIGKKLHRKMEKYDVVIDSEWVNNNLPARKSESHKGTYGSMLVCGGSVNFPGAPIFTARSGYLIGAGLVKTAVPERIYDAVVGSCLESTWVILDDESGVIAESACKLITREFQGTDCLAIGPGMAQEDTTLRFLQALLENTREQKQNQKMGLIPSSSAPLAGPGSKIPPLVIDADGLKLLARITGWQKTLDGKQVVLTPHPGEMRVLTGLPVSDIQSDRIEICRKFAREWKQCVVLKGALTVVASLDGQVAVCPVATSALAKAGSGDLLTGLIAGLIAQGAELFDAATMGVWIHAKAGLLAAEIVGSERSVVLDDILMAIPEVVSSLK